MKVIWVLWAGKAIDTCLASSRDEASEIFLRKHSMAVYMDCLVLSEADCLYGVDTPVAPTQNPEEMEDDEWNKALDEYYDDILINSDGFPGIQY